MKAVSIDFIRQVSLKNEESLARKGVYVVLLSTKIAIFCDNEMLCIFWPSKSTSSLNIEPISIKRCELGFDFIVQNGSFMTSELIQRNI